MAQPAQAKTVEQAARMRETGETKICEYERKRSEMVEVSALSWWKMTPPTLRQHLQLNAVPD
eukprot:2651617-Prorocentrum_lima.AAC.1